MMHTLVVKSIVLNLTCSNQKYKKTILTSDKTNVNAMTHFVNTNNNE